MLTFVGLGLYDERSITVEGRAAVSRADRVFVELYTSRLAGATVADLEEFHGVDIERRDREGVERDPGPVLGAAADGEAVLLVAGDPFVSTTHVDLRLRAHERGIETGVVHGTSAATAAASLSGLQNYRFGKSTTLPFPEGYGGVPDSVLGTVRGNRERGLHTLVYLDVRAAEDRYLTADRAAAALADADDPSAVGVAVARAGSPDPVVAADRLDGLADRAFGDPPHLLVLAGELHHVEARALVELAGAPPGAVGLDGGDPEGGDGDRPGTGGEGD